MVRPAIKRQPQYFAQRAIYLVISAGFILPNCTESYQEQKGSKLFIVYGKIWRILFI